VPTHLSINPEDYRKPCSDFFKVEDLGPQQKTLHQLPVSINARLKNDRA
jgi:hypothetical protein